MDIYAARKYVCSKSEDDPEVDTPRICEKGTFDGPILTNPNFEASSKILHEMERRHRVSLCSDEVSPVKIDPSDDLPKVPPRLCKAFCDGGFGSSTHNDGDNAEYLKKELGFQLSNGKQYEGWEPWHEHIPCTKLGGTCVPEDPDDDEPCANSGINDTPMRNMYGGCSKDSPVCCLTPCAAMTRGEINPDIFQCLGNGGIVTTKRMVTSHTFSAQKGRYAPIRGSAV